MPDIVTLGLALLAAAMASCVVSLWAIYGVLAKLLTLARRDQERARDTLWP